MFLFAGFASKRRKTNEVKIKLHNYVLLECQGRIQDSPLEGAPTL